MPVIAVEPSDPRVDPYRSLSDADLLRDRGLFVAEGRLVVERVLRSGRYRLVSALMNAASVSALGPLLDAVAPDVPVFRIGTSAFESITGYNMHRGCLALVNRPATMTWEEAVGDSRLVVVLEGITDADNVGGVFRNAAAFGAGAVLLSPTCCDPLYRKAVRTSMGAVLTVPFARVEPWADELPRLRAAGFAVVALTPNEPAIRLDAFVRTAAAPRVALMAGTEGAGLTTAAEAAAEYRVRIPIRDRVDSLNVSVAVAVALSWLDRDRCAD